MDKTLYFEFSCKGHDVKVRHLEIPDQWLGDNYSVVTVRIDDKRVVIPNILDAYLRGGKPGVELLVGAYLDNSL